MVQFKKRCFVGCLLVLFLSLPAFVFGQEESQEIKQDEQKENEAELIGDSLEFLMDENKAIAQGNVSIKKGEVTILCDRLEFYRATQMVYAEGNVTLMKDKERFTGERLKFDFNTQTGSFLKVKFESYPLFGVGEKIYKESENHMVMLNGYLTTCDLDKPTYRMVSKKIDVYPGDKAVARHVRLMVGNIPLFYVPRFTQNLTDNKPAFLITPGYDKQWGGFILTQYRYYLNDYIKGTLHLDYRERKDLAGGVDLNYETKDHGDGLVKMYYMNERNITSKRVWEEKPSPTIERERFKIEWRHKWDIDSKTKAIFQYYRLSDNDFLRDYYEREFDRDSNPKTFFVVTKTMPFGTLSFRTDARVNRFVSAVERLPEVSYTLPSQKILSSNFYINSTSTFSNLTSKAASPSEERDKTMRFAQENQLSYPFKLGVFEIKPYVGGKQIYYSRVIDPQEDNTIRGQFLTGADVSTKFYRIFDFHSDAFGLDISRLRHIVTPSVAYSYIHDPTIFNSKFDQFDSYDSLTRSHKLQFTLENKLQTKRDRKSVDLVRFIMGSAFLLKEDPGKGGINNITADIEVTPTDWLAFYSDWLYDTLAERLDTVNFDIILNGEDDDWSFRLGKRYQVNANDQVTGEFVWRINPKWKFKMYHRFDVSTGTYEEQEYAWLRDLHAWTMEINYNRTARKGDEVWIVFTLKAFPELGFDFGTSFNRYKRPGPR